MPVSKTPSMIILLLFFAFPVLLEASQIHLDELKLPDGFKAEVYSDGVANARGMALSGSGTLFVGSMREGKVYAIIATPGGKKVLTIARGLDMPVGVALYNGDLYISAVSRILRIRDVEGHLYGTPQPEVVSGAFPADEMHGWKFIKFGPDNKLYVPVGAPCNVCLKDDKRYATIMRMDPDGGGLEVYAGGIRNTVGFDWDPATGKMWFTDNGRDNMGDNIPPDELDFAPKQGMNFGFPFVHGADIRDPVFWDKRPKDFQFTPPAMQLGPHVAALGMRFYTGKMFPADYDNVIFIAEHGSWNRSKKIGYRVTMVKVKDGKALSYGVFCRGWKQGENVWGRPADVQVALDGSLLVSDDLAGVIYRIYYTGKRPKGVM